MSNDKAVYHAIGAIKGQERGPHFMKTLVVFVGIFVVLVLGVKFGNELSPKTIDVGAEARDAREGSAQVQGGATQEPTVFTPPDANYEKVPMDDVSFPRSSYKCTDDPDVNKVCVFKNLVLYQGELLYVVEYPDEVSGPNAVVMPNPTVFDLEAETLSIVDYAVPNIVHPVTAESLRLRIKSGTTKKSLNVARYEQAMFQVCLAAGFPPPCVSSAKGTSLARSHGHTITSLTSLTPSSSSSSSSPLPPTTARAVVDQLVLGGEQHKQHVPPVVRPDGCVHAKASARGGAAAAGDLLGEAPDGAAPGHQDGTAQFSVRRAQGLPRANVLGGSSADARS